MILSRLALALLGLALTVLEVVQQSVLDSNPTVHTAIAVALVTIGALGASKADAGYLGGLLPPRVVAVLTTLAVALQGANTAADIGRTAHTIIGAALVLFATIGINPRSLVAFHGTQTQRQQAAP